jgi:hypothetical protein
VVARIAEFFGAERRETAAAKSALPTPHVLRRAVGKADDVRC